MDTELTREREQEAARAAVLAVHVRALEDQHERITRAAEQFLALAGELAVAPQTLEHRPTLDRASHPLTGWTVRQPVFAGHADRLQPPQAGIWVLVDGRVVVGMTPTPKSALSRVTGCAVRFSPGDLVRTGAGNGIVAPGQASRVARIDAGTNEVIDALREWIRTETARTAPD